MGLQVRYFMPPGSVAPLAFYFRGDLLGDYSNLELIGAISAMEAFQKIYRPESYNANSVAGKVYQPSLKHQDYSSTRIVYDREERSQLAVKQGRGLPADPSISIRPQETTRNVDEETAPHLHRRQPAQALLAGRARKALVALEAAGRRLDRRQAGRAAPVPAGTAACRYRYRQRR
ncbi:hypothetical protein G6F57_017817 [Rhizopus arrhizus]|nr:hypothetical protein G6F57_017817 [Rhizopus arrhizus]